VFDSTFVTGGRIAGTWRRIFKKRAVVVEIAAFNRLTPAEDTAIVAAAQRYGDFLGMTVIIQKV
jgi:hypothetical protein